MQLTYVFKTFDVWPKKLNHDFNNDKYYCLFYILWNKLLLPATWQYEKHYILKAEQDLLDEVYTEV